MFTRWYSSRVDAWLAIVLVLAPVMVVGGGAIAIAAGQVLAGLIGPAFLALVYGGLVLPVRYGISDRDLIVRSGLVRTTVALAEIREVVPTRSPWSAPALSLDRLRVRRGSGHRTVLISPRDQQDFLRVLAVAAGLRLDGDRLVRGAT